MRRVVIGLAVVLMAGKVSASPLVDLLIGVAMLGNGAVFEVQRKKAAEEVSQADNDATYNINRWQTQLVTANYYKGAADWELLSWGASPEYYAFYHSFTINYNDSQRHLAAGKMAAEKSGEAQDRERLYKGVSLTSFGVGSFFVVKGVATYLWQRGQATKQKAGLIQELAQHVEIEPTPGLEGVRATYSYRF